MKKLPYILLGALALAGNTFGQTTATSDPVGFNSVTALGNSDTRFSVPLQRPNVFTGTVASVSGNVVTVSGTPAWTTNQFVYAAGTQSNTYYLEFKSGAKVGMFYTVTANAAGTLTLNLNGDSISTVAANDSFKLVPYWTLSTLFPNQAGITATTSISGSAPVTDILIPDVTSAGTDLGAPSGYFYYSGTGFGGAGWRAIGGSPSQKVNDTPLSPDGFLIVRQDGVSTSSILTATGAVPTNVRKYVIGTLQANVDQDNAVGIDIPVGLSLTQSNLFQSNAFAGTSLISGDQGDQLLVFDDTTADFDKAATTGYFYYTGTAFGGAGWRLIGGSPTAKQDAVTVFQPGSGYIIRKAGVASPQSVVWSLPLPY